MTSPQRKAALIAAAVGVLVACIGVLALVLLQLRTPPTPDPLTSADARRLVENKNLGLAYLENHDTAQSIPIFEDLVARLPEEPLGPRCLAVAHVLALGEEFEHATPQRIAAARTALALVHDSEGATPQWHWLSARTEWAAQAFDAAIKHLTDLVADDPRNASAWYELFLVRRARGLAPDSSEARTALERALDLRPDNLFLLVEYLRQLDEHAAKRQAAVARFTSDRERLERARQTLLPFRERMQVVSQVDIVQLVDEAIAAIENESPALLAERAGQLARVTLGLAAQDRNQIRRHVLEFMLFRFRPEFYEEYGLHEAEPAPAIQVSFDATSAWQIDASVQSSLATIEAIELADFDLDGRLDLVVVDTSGVHVLSRDAGTGAWRRLGEPFTIKGMTGLVVADLDLDFDETPSDSAKGPGPKVETATPGTAAACPSADVDVVAYGLQGVVVLRNLYAAATGARSLERIEQQVDNLTSVTAAAPADLDGDGDLDLVVAGENGLSVWSNRGNAAFEEISSRSSLLPSEEKVNQIVAIDWDRDVDVDVLVGGSPAGWLENLRHGQMRWHPFSGDFPALSDARALEPLDMDANGSWDLLAATAVGLQLQTTATAQPGVIRALDARKVADGRAQKLRSLDYDNDAVLDVIAWERAGLAVYRGLSDGRFQVIDLMSAAKNVRDCTCGDLDRDGDLDVVVASTESLSVFLNQGGNQNQWLDVALVARQIKGSETTASGRVNAHGLGSLLELKSGTRYQPAVVRAQSTHFGLGRSKAEVIRVMWLNGVPQNILHPPAGQTICEQQVLTGSCPYLYTWNGAAFEFVTDLLWAAPLGLQAADGVLLPWREWEYLKIPGEKLVAKDSHFVLQLTEELWEAAYFDQVKLIAVDHPADVDIYSNEKVGPPDIAQFKIHAAQEKRRPITVRNHRGRDLSSEVAKEDGVYARPFDCKLRQGLVEDHYLELDLGDVVGANRVTLFLTGWIYPSGTSLNVAISQNPELPQPKPPALLAPDGSGGWREALPFMGFPGGKTKTIAVNLTGLLTKGDGRLRIATNLELYWDQIFFTVDETPVELRQTELPLRGADLHFRGFSRIVHDAGNGPEDFQYDEVSTAPKWPPMQGRFTRFGDVTELIRQRDDRLVVLAAGDEVTLRFEVPSVDPPAGWKRDFLLYSVGWDKDANLCTVVGDAVEPLPFASMRSYPPGPADLPPDTAEYRQYLRNYQTRIQNDAFWRSVHSAMPGR